MDPFNYMIDAVVTARKLGGYLPENVGYSLRIEKGEKLEGRVVDTFDDEILKSGMVLLQVDKELLLIDLNGGQLLRQPLSGKWKMAADLGAGEVQRVLQRVSSLRAFLPVARVKFRLDQGLLLDDESKTRARFRNLLLDHKKKSLSLGVTQYLRGYQKGHQDLVMALEGYGAVAARDLKTVYRRLGIARKEYTAKPKLPLSADAPARVSAITIIDAFIGVARANEAGVIGDYDTEFLHDYRVSFRKVRSVLSLFKGVFSLEETIALKTEFAALMQSTNRLRDLDVYLLERQSYFALVPETAHEGLTALFAYLQKERKKELKQVVERLQSSSYKKQQRRLKKLFVGTGRLSSGPQGDVPAKEFGSRLVVKRYHQVCRIAAKIDANTEDEKVHQLRISCKKLRYLMEFFAPFFPGDEIKKLIKNLKILQDNLGNFNDYSVQQDFLRQILLTRLSAFRENEIQVTEAIGALTAMLYRLQVKEKKQVMKNFARFDSEETRELIKKLFQQGGES